MYVRDEYTRQTDRIRVSDDRAVSIRRRRNFVAGFQKSPSALQSWLSSRIIELTSGRGELLDEGTQWGLLPRRSRCSDEPTDTQLSLRRSSFSTRNRIHAHMHKTHPIRSSDLVVTRSRRSTISSSFSYPFISAPICVFLYAAAHCASLQSSCPRYDSLSLTSANTCNLAPNEKEDTFE